jgi:hypothetical protein
MTLVSHLDAGGRAEDAPAAQTKARNRKPPFLTYRSFLSQILFSIVLGKREHPSCWFLRCNNLNV